MRGSRRPVSSKHDRQEGGSRVTEPRTNRITLRAPRPETPRSNSLATTGDRRTGGLPAGAGPPARHPVPPRTPMGPFASKKGSIHSPPARRPAGPPPHSPRAPPPLLLGPP